MLTELWVFSALFVNYLPTPLVLLTAADGTQNVHIAYEAFTIASAEFPDQISVWQDALPLNLKGKLETVCELFSTYHTLMTSILALRC